MTSAFNDSTLLNLDGIRENNKKSFLEGYKFLAMGTIQSIRNILSHGDEETRSPEECFEMLLFINWLFRIIE